MENENTPWEKEWEKFQNEWEPTDDLAKQAEIDEKRFEKGMSLLAAVAHGLDKQIVAVQARTAELHEVQKSVRASEDKIHTEVQSLLRSFMNIETWWDEKIKEMQGIVGALVSMDIGFTLDDEQP